MADKKPLVDKIAEFVKKTGFPLENDCVRLLSSKGWGVTKGPPFLDPDESILRELDIVALRTKRFGDEALPNPLVAMQLMVECKTSEKPWIFFPASAGMYAPLASIRHITSIERLLHTGPVIPTTKPAMVTFDELATWGHPYSKPVSNANTYLEYTSNPKDASGYSIRSALMTAVKATDNYMERLKGSAGGVTKGYAVFYYPIVVLRGLLFEATTDEKGNLVVRSSNHVRVGVNYLFPGEEFDFGRMLHIVDVLHEDALAQYVEWVEASHVRLFERVGQLLRESEKPTAS